MGFRQILVERLLNQYGEFVRPQLEALSLPQLVVDEYNLTFEGHIYEHPQYTRRMFNDDPNFTVWANEDGEEWDVVTGASGELLTYWEWVERQIAVSGEEPLRQPLPYSKPLSDSDPDGGGGSPRPILTLSDKEKERILDLAAYDQPPNDDVEQHFLHVLAGSAEPLTLKEKEWLEYYRQWKADEQAEELGYCIDTPEARAEYRRLHAWEKELDDNDEI